MTHCRRGQATGPSLRGRSCRWATREELRRRRVSVPVTAAAAPSQVPQQWAEPRDRELTTMTEVLVAAAAAVAAAVQTLDSSAIAVGQAPKALDQSAVEIRRRHHGLGSTGGLAARGSPAKMAPRPGGRAIGAGFGTSSARAFQQSRPATPHDGTESSDDGKNDAGVEPELPRCPTQRVARTPGLGRLPGVQLPQGRRDTPFPLRRALHLRGVATALAKEA